MRASRLVAACVGLALVALGTAAQAQTLPPAVRACNTPEAFGYNERSVLGTRPLLIVLVGFTDAALSPARNAAYFQNLVFGAPATPTSPPTIASIYQAASNGRFSFSNARIVQVNWPGGGETTGEAEAYDMRVTQLTAEAMRRGGVTLESFDRDGNRVVDDTEVTVLRVSNSPDFRGGGQTRWHQAGFGAGYTWRGQTANVDEEMDINGIAHELFHAIGFPDHIYGPGAGLNIQASFMAASYTVASSPGAIPLDPHHRMRAGWLRPVLANTSTSGSARLALYGGGHEGTSVLFYDPARCGDEFFIADVHQPGQRTSIEGGAMGSGVYLWYVKVAPGGGYTPFQFNWPPPIRGPYREAGGNHAIANYIVGPGGAGVRTVFNWNTPEFQPTWGDGATAAFGIEVGQVGSRDPNFIGWRRVPGRYIARIDAINGGRAAATIANQAGAEIVLTGMFPARSDGIRAELINLSGRIRVPMTYAPDRVTIRLSAPVPAGAYQVHLVRDTPRDIVMRGPQIVNIR